MNRGAVDAGAAQAQYCAGHLCELTHDLQVEAPAWDPDFNTADLPMPMRLNDLPARYRRHFLGR